MSDAPQPVLARVWGSLRDGFRWWMVPVLVLLFGGLLALVVLTGMSTMSAVRYTAI